MLCLCHVVRQGRERLESQILTNSTSTPRRVSAGPGWTANSQHGGRTIGGQRSHLRLCSTCRFLFRQPNAHCREGKTIPLQANRQKPSQRLPSVLNASSLLSHLHFTGLQQELRPKPQACLAARFFSPPPELTPKKRRCLPRKLRRRRRSY